MLRFYAAINEQRPAEAQREERQGPEAKRAEAAPKPVGTLLLSDLAEEACPLKEVSRFPIGSGTASTADKQGENKAAVVQALPAGGPLTADGGDGLWDLSSEITVSAMPYM